MIAHESSGSSSSVVGDATEENIIIIITQPSTQLCSTTHLQ